MNEMNFQDTTTSQFPVYKFGKLALSKDCYILPIELAFCTSPIASSNSSKVQIPGWYASDICSSFVKNEDDVPDLLDTVCDFSLSLNFLNTLCINYNLAKPMLKSSSAKEVMDKFLDKIRFAVEPSNVKHFTSNVSVDLALPNFDYDFKVTALPDHDCVILRDSDERPFMFMYGNHDALVIGYKTDDGMNYCRFKIPEWTYATLPDSKRYVISNRTAPFTAYVASLLFISGFVYNLDADQIVPMVQGDDLVFSEDSVTNVEFYDEIYTMVGGDKRLYETKAN